MSKGDPTMTFLKQEWRMNLKSFLIWTISVGGMVLCFMLLYNSMKGEMDSISDAYSNMGSFSNAFGLDKISFTTPMGFYGIEAGSVLVLGGGLFAGLLGISLLSKEEGGHAAEFIYVTPNSRNYFITQKIISMVTLLAAFDIICLICGILGFAGVDGDIEWKKLLLYHLALYFLYLEISCICFGVSAFLRKNNIGLGIGIVFILYFANMMANITSSVKKLHYITPFYFSDAANIFSSATLEYKYILIGMLFSLLSIIVAYIKYNKKDLRI